ncbi:MAG TPA: serine hydrolase, partial [Pyrinomonadaceae bacterium]|nr:serine hydrolase [Pyrinomonadaceae bacterium]
PGLAIAIVKDDKIVYAKGFGVREIGKSDPVDEKTVFAIGSASKAFTAASLAILIDEGKLKWDDPATNYLPGFQLFDPYATRELTVRDLLCHRVGLERGDLLWYASQYGRDEVLRRIRYLKPSSSFRSRFGYQNIMYLAAGQIIPSVTKTSWDDFVKERIFTPLNMNSTSTSIKSLANSPNVASPHSKFDDKVVAIPWRAIDNIGPAGSINSNVVDMAQWLRLNLASGKFNGKQLISNANIKEMQTPQMVIRPEGAMAILYPQAHFLNYGLGWFLSDYSGRKLVEHGGSIDGMRSLVAMLPEENLGVVILTNLSGSVVSMPIAYRIFDAYLKLPPRDWSSEMLKSVKAQQQQAQAALKKIEDARVKDTKPSLALEKYAGTYADEMYGTATVKTENGKLVLMRGSNFVGDLEHWNYDVFRVTWRDRQLGKGFVSFRLNRQGVVDILTIENLSDFKRVPEAKSESQK